MNKQIISWCVVIYLKQSNDMWCIQDALARVLNMRVDAFLYQIGESETGQPIEQIHVVQILVGLIEADD